MVHYYRLAECTVTITDIVPPEVGPVKENMTLKVGPLPYMGESGQTSIGRYGCALEPSAGNGVKFQ